MRTTLTIFASLLTFVLLPAGTGLWSAESNSTYLLEAALPAGSTIRAKVQLEVGGEMLVPTEEELKRLPMEVRASFDYREQLVKWSADAATIARSVRKYDKAEAHIKVDQEQITRTLPAEEQLLLAEVRAGESLLAVATGLLNREQMDLVNTVGNTLVIDRLLPGKEMKEGESWKHDAATIQALLCMDHVAVCEVTSVVTEEKLRQVQIRLAGTVHGTVDGTPTEMELRGAYLFHLDAKRITKFNLAIKESRKPSDLVPGLDVVAKVNVSVTPHGKELSIPAEVRKVAENTKTPLSRKLRYESQEGNFSFEYDSTWYITAEERDLISLRELQDHELAAHCNLNVLPPRSEGRQTTLEQFERDIRESLGDKLESVTAATAWKTEQGHDCLGIIAVGSVDEVPMEWRYYLVSDENCPRLSLAVTLEQSRRKAFADAERQIIDTLQLVQSETTTARKAETQR